MPVAIVLGVSYKDSGAGIGRTTALSLKQAGYNVAVVGRTLNLEAATKDGFLGLTADLDNHENAKEVVDKVTEKLGAPSVLVYNVPKFTIGTFDQPIENIKAALGGPVISFYAAIQAFITISQSLTDKKFVFFVGNMTNDKVMPNWLTLGLGKAGGAYLIKSGAVNEELKGKGYQFYYLDQRASDGKPAFGPALSGQAHAEIIQTLMGNGAQGEPVAIFTKDGLANF